MMKLGRVVAERLELISGGKFDVFKVSKEALCIYQSPEYYLTKDLDAALLSLMAMEEGAEFEMTEKEFRDLLSRIREM